MKTFDVEVDINDKKETFTFEKPKVRVKNKWQALVFSLNKKSKSEEISKFLEMRQKLITKLIISSTFDYKANPEWIEDLYTEDLELIIGKIEEKMKVIPDFATNSASQREADKQEIQK